ncbi:MAG: hypothetical protein AAFU64_16640, partial [Bacteroidota bacterium]
GYIIKNDYLEAAFKPEAQLIQVKWFPESKFMSEETYREILLKLSSYVLTHQVKCWLGDTKEFAYIISPELQAWTSDTFTKELLEAGLEKMALIIPTAFIANLGVQQTVEEMENRTAQDSIETRYFDNYEDAQHWIEQAGDKINK